MSKKAIQAPGPLADWDWRDPDADDRQLDRLNLEVWSRPEHRRAERAAAEQRSTDRVRLSQALVWIGLTVTGMVGLAAALATIYVGLGSLTGVVGTPVLPALLLVAAAIGLLAGIIGVVVEQRHHEPARSAHPR